MKLYNTTNKKQILRMFLNDFYIAFKIFQSIVQLCSIDFFSGFRSGDCAANLKLTFFLFCNQAFNVSMFWVIIILKDLFS